MTEINEQNYERLGKVPELIKLINGGAMSQAACVTANLKSPTYWPKGLNVPTNLRARRLVMSRQCIVFCGRWPPLKFAWNETTVLSHWLRWECFCVLTCRIPCGLGPFGAASICGQSREI